MIASGARPKLARKARLKLDRHSGEHWLIYPERGMRLNASAARIAALCQGELQISEIVERLTAETSPDNRERIEQDVQRFLASLIERGLLSWIP